MRITLPCGCRRDGSRVCDDHARPQVRNGVAGLTILFFIVALLFIVP